MIMSKTVIRAVKYMKSQDMKKICQIICTQKSLYAGADAKQQQDCNFKSKTSQDYTGRPCLVKRKTNERTKKQPEASITQQCDSAECGLDKRTKVYTYLTGDRVSLP